MTKQEFTTQLTDALQAHAPGKAVIAAANEAADLIEQRPAVKGAAAAIDWAHWLQVLESVIQVLAPLLQPVAKGAKKK